MFTTEINGIPLTFETRPSLFSPNAADRGTIALLHEADVFLARTLSLDNDPQQNNPQQGNPVKIHDLGCGYGLIGLYLAKRYAGRVVVYMSDADPAAVACARANAARNTVSDVITLVSDGFDTVDETGYTLILSNPPYHTDFSVAKRFIEKGFNRLALGGAMCMVTKRQEWYKRKFIAVFGGVKMAERDGYTVFTGEKRNTQWACANKPKNNSRRQTPAGSN